MDWFDNGVYMVRDAGFGRDFTPKVWVTLIALALVAWDVRRQRRWDYAWVFLIGSVIWALAEVFLSVQGIRDMPERVLFGSPMPMWASYVLQGTSEAAFVAVLGLFVGDRLLVRATRSRAMGFFVAITALTVAAVWRAGRLVERGEVASRRDLLAPTALIALPVVTLVTVWFIWKRVPWRPRALAMAAVMLLFATLWTIAQVAAGGRWVEVGTATGGYAAAAPLVSFAGLAFDVVVEIVIAYVPFLALAVGLGLMRDPRPLAEV